MLTVLPTGAEVTTPAPRPVPAPVASASTVVVDVTPACEYPDAPSHPAAAAVRCRKCTTVQLLCAGHLDELRATAVNLARRSMILVCTACRAHGDSFDAVVEVVPL